MAVQTAPLLVRVAPEDMVAAFQRAKTGKDGFIRKGMAGESLEGFIANRTKGRVADVRGPAWEAFFADLARAGAGDAATWAGRRGTSYAHSSFFFRPDEAPLDAAAPQLAAGNGFVFLRLSAADGPRYAGLTQVRAADAAATAPSALAFPRRSMAPWVALAAIAAYGLVPWPRHRDERTLGYRRSRAVIVPDLSGAIMACLFFGLPFLIVGTNSSSGSVFQEGWVFLTGTLWLIGAGFASILGFSAWYAAFRLVVCEDELRYVTLFGTRILPFTEVERVDLADYRPPKWLRTLLFIAGAFNWRLMGQALLLNARGDWGIALVMRDGRRVRIMMSYLDGAARLVDALETAGVPVAAIVRREAPRTDRALS